jgi:hypothetical protein
MGRLRDESLEEIIIDLECLDFFGEMKKKYEYTRIGFGFRDLHTLMTKLVKRMIRRHEKNFNESLDIKLIRRIRDGNTVE